MFVSALYLVMDVAAGEIRFANAGHPNPLHLRREVGAVEPLRFADGKPGPALGVFEDSVYATASRPLAVRDLVILFTDGLFEVDSRHQEQYGQDRLLTAVRQRIHQPLSALLGELLADIQQFSGAAEFVDDVCLVGIEVARVGQATKEGQGG
jgi:sigma-B regulation protein RsbU (phosphoserine phosphatase)